MGTRHVRAYTTHSLSRAHIRVSMKWKCELHAAGLLQHHTHSMQKMRTMNNIGTAHTHIMAMISMSMKVINYILSNWLMRLCWSINAELSTLFQTEVDAKIFKYIIHSDFEHQNVETEWLAVWILSLEAWSLFNVFHDVIGHIVSCRGASNIELSTSQLYRYTSTMQVGVYAKHIDQFKL